MEWGTSSGPDRAACQAGLFHRQSNTSQDHLGGPCQACSVQGKPKANNVEPRKKRVPTAC